MIDFDNLLKKNAIPSSFKRGKLLYQNRKVFDLEYTVSKGEVNCEAYVTGRANTYKTNLKVFDNGLSSSFEVVSSSCTCPYDWTGICKHQVAVLMALRAKMRQGHYLRGNQSKKTARPIKKEGVTFPMKFP